jgi:hypothetical protein
MITGTYNLEANPSWALLQFYNIATGSIDGIRL